MSEEVKSNSCQEASNDAKECKKSQEANAQSSAPVLPTSNCASNQNSESRQLELYSPNAAGLWSLALSVVFGSWCIWQNYKTIGDEKAEKRSRIWMYSLVGIIVITLFLPDGVARYITVPLLLIWYFAEQRPQVKYLKDKNIEFNKKPWKKPVCTAVAILLLFFGFSVVISSCSGNSYEDAVIQTTTNILSGRGFSMRCVKITNVKSLGNNQYRAKAVLRSEAGVTGFMDITYEVVDDSVVVKADVQNIVYNYRR